MFINILEKLTQEHLCRSLFLKKLQAEGNIFKNIFFIEHLAGDCFLSFPEYKKIVSKFFCNHWR